MIACTTFLLSESFVKRSVSALLNFGDPTLRCVTEGFAFEMSSVLDCNPVKRELVSSHSYSSLNKEFISNVFSSMQCNDVLFYM